MCYQVQQNANQSDDHLLSLMRHCHAAILATAADFVCKGFSHIQICGHMSTNLTSLTACFNQIKILSQRWPSPYQLLILNKNLNSPTHLSFFSVSLKFQGNAAFSWFAPVSQYFCISVCLFVHVHALIIDPACCLLHLGPNAHPFVGIQL